MFAESRSVRREPSRGMLSTAINVSPERQISSSFDSSRGTDQSIVSPPPRRKVRNPAEVCQQPRSKFARRESSAARSTHLGTGQTHRVAVAVEEGLQPTRGLPGDRDRSSPTRRYQHLAHNQSGERLDSSKPRPIAHFEKERKKRVDE